MEITTIIKNTPGLIISGLLFIIIFGWMLKRSIGRNDFSERTSKLMFLLDHYELIGGILIGVVLLLLAIWG
ncbi:hypothetical protein [Desulfosporosinus fructosivorans]